MAVVRMDIEQADQTIRDFDAAFQAFSESLQPLTAAVDQLGQAWQGAAAGQFRAAWESWIGDVTNRVNALQPMRQGVAAERQQMLDADSSAGFA